MARMTQSRARLVQAPINRAACILGALVATYGCKPPSTVDAVFTVSGVDLKLPRLEGWVQDPTVSLEDPAKGGIAMRLQRESAVAGSPRIDVLLSPAAGTPMAVEEFLTENLREMGQLESGKQIRILDVQQTPIKVGSHRAYRVRHEYVMGEGRASQVSITQLSTFVAIKDRGVAVTAAGRTELFHPLAQSIEDMLNGIRTGSQSKLPTAAPRKLEETRLPPDLVKPIDLGKIGGKK